MKNKTYKRDHTHFEILLLFVYGDGIFNMVALSGKKKKKKKMFTVLIIIIIIIFDVMF